VVDHRVRRRRDDDLRAMGLVQRRGLDDLAPVDGAAAKCRRSHCAKSRAEELTPPDGDCASGSRVYLAIHLPSCWTWPSARFGAATKSANRELVLRMPSGR